MGYSGFLLGTRSPRCETIAPKFNIEGARHVSICWSGHIGEDDCHLCRRRNGRVLLETMVDSSPDESQNGYASLTSRSNALAWRQGRYRNGSTAGSLTWAAAICVETRHMHAALSARINKTDRNDARGIAQMMRVGLFKAVHVKSPRANMTSLLTSRKLLQRKIYDIENDLRGSLRNFGLKVGVVGAVKFEDRIRELVADHPLVAAIVGPLLEARAVLRVQFAKLHRMLLELVRTDPICRRLMSAPGVGPIVALTFRTCVDNPARFSRSKCVGAHYGLTPRLYQSGEVARTGRISGAAT